MKLGKDDSGYFASIAFVVDDENMIEIDHVHKSIKCVKVNQHFTTPLFCKRLTIQELSLF